VAVGAATEIGVEKLKEIAAEVTRKILLGEPGETMLKAAHELAPAPPEISKVRMEELRSLEAKSEAHFGAARERYLRDVRRVSEEVRATADVLGGKMKEMKIEEPQQPTIEERQKALGPNVERDVVVLDREVSRKDSYVETLAKAVMDRPEEKAKLQEGLSQEELKTIDSKVKEMKPKAVEGHLPPGEERRVEPIGRH
jgi:hypothetical protein